MEDFQDQDILEIQDDFEYNFGVDGLLGQGDQEEPMEQDHDSDILEEEKSAELVDSEEQNLFGLGGKELFEQEDPAPSPQSSLYGMSQLIADVNVPTQEENPDNDPEVPACSHEELVKECVKNIPKPDPNLDWLVEMNSRDRCNACQEEQ